MAHRDCHHHGLARNRLSERHPARDITREPVTSKLQRLRGGHFSCGDARSIFDHQMIDVNGRLQPELNALPVQERNHVGIGVTIAFQMH
jgi:hypothetical protein